MLRNCLAAALLALCCLFARTACAFFDPPYLTPEAPVAGELVSVNIRGGVCDTILGLPGWPHISQVGNSIRIVFWGVRNEDPILCNYPVGTGTFAVGAYPAGSYTLQVDLEYFGDLGGILSETLGVIPFTVTASAAQPAALPSLNGIGLGILGLTLLVRAMRRLRRARTLALLSIVLNPSLPNVYAQTAPPGAAPANHVVELLVTTAPGAPTPEQIIAYFERPSGAPPLQGLAVENPLSAEFLLAQRAEGDFLQRLQEHPDSVRAKLERYLLVVYPDGADLDRAVDALRADPYVASAQEPVPMDFSSVDLVDFQVDNAPETYSQYGRDALDIDAAWDITGGGYALVADIDSGLYVNSAALRQFSGSQYVGGNFMPVASLDISGRGLKPRDRGRPERGRTQARADFRSQLQSGRSFHDVRDSCGTRHTYGRTDRGEWRRRDRSPRYVQKLRYCYVEGGVRILRPIR